MSKCMYEDQISAILNCAKLRLETLMFHIETKASEEVKAEARGKVSGLLEAARILTITKGDPDGGYDCDYLSFDCDGIYRNNELVVKI